MSTKKNIKHHCTSNSCRVACMTCSSVHFLSAKYPIQNVTIQINVKEESELPHLPPHATHLAGVWAHYMSEWVSDPDSLMEF